MLLLYVQDRSFFGTRQGLFWPYCTDFRVGSGQSTRCQTVNPVVSVFFWRGQSRGPQSRSPRVFWRGTAKPARVSCVLYSFHYNAFWGALAHGAMLSMESAVPV